VALVAVSVSVSCRGVRVRVSASWGIIALSSKTDRTQSQGLIQIRIQRGSGGKPDALRLQISTGLEQQRIEEQRNTNTTGTKNKRD
ncbi:hypothetical protein A2U01_0072298, partial [Trifolium medium]|nr:hypothetical protein [Trifolium medium]